MYKKDKIRWWTLSISVLTSLCWHAARPGSARGMVFRMGYISSKASPPSFCPVVSLT